MEKQLKLGVVGLDGHGAVFIPEVNKVGSPIKGAKVVAASPWPSRMVTEEKLKENVAAVRALGVEIVEDAAKLAAAVDGILILHDDGGQHLELARRFVGFGKPVYVDKPLEVSSANAAELAALYRRSGCPLFSGSVLRYTPEMRKVKQAAADGAVLGAMTWSPYLQSPAMPGWIYYAIHAVEPLFELMGPGCVNVECHAGKHGPVAVGHWPDGRLGVAKATSGGEHGYGFTVWREKATVTTAVATDGIYQGLLEAIVEFIRTGKAPTPPEEEVEVIAFMEKANLSMGLWP